MPLLPARSLVALVPLAGLLHLRLVRADPAPNAQVAASPAELRLWLSQRPTLSVTSVRLLDARGAAVPTGPLTMAGDAKAPLVVPVRARLAPGRYTVRWRTMARDGHVVDGSFAFAVTAPAGGARAAEGR
jgi:methionine-rich copper-binding protein CopC